MQKLALCIGINDYPGSNNDLSGCINDAHDWADELSGRGFSVEVLSDKEATRSAVIAAIKEIFYVNRKGDSVVVQYSGHGTQVPDTSGDEADGFDEAICLYNGLLYDDEIWSLMKLKKPGVRLVFISDSCHSGSVVRAFQPASIGKPKFVPYQRIAKLVRPRDVRPAVEAFEADKSPWPCLLMSGCQDNEYSYDANFGGKANGAFSRFALDALQRMDANATYQQWYDAIRKGLPSMQYPQTPNILGSYKNVKIFS